MSFTQGEVGKDHNVNGAFDMSANTELSLIYSLPDGITTITKTSADGVVLGLVDITDPDTGVTFLANEYVVYSTEPGFLSQSGTWSVYLQYDNSVSSVTYIGKCTTFQVEDPTNCT